MFGVQHIVYVFKRWFALQLVRLDLAQRFVVSKVQLIFWVVLYLGVFKAKSVLLWLIAICGSIITLLVIGVILDKMKIQRYYDEEMINRGKVIDYLKNIK